jgi:hypothetical protein
MGVYQEYLSETALPRQTAYHSIVPLYVRGDTRLPRSHLGAVPLLVSAPYATSDKAHYGAHGLALLNGIRTRGVVREERCSKKALFFP